MTTRHGTLARSTTIITFCREDFSANGSTGKIARELDRCFSVVVRGMKNFVDRRANERQRNASSLELKTRADVAKLARLPISHDGSASILYADEHKSALESEKAQETFAKPFLTKQEKSDVFEASTLASGTTGSVSARARPTLQTLSFLVDSQDADGERDDALESSSQEEEVDDDEQEIYSQQMSQNTQMENIIDHISAQVQHGYKGIYRQSLLLDIAARCKVRTVSEDEQETQGRPRELDGEDAAHDNEDYTNASALSAVQTQSALQLKPAHVDLTQSSPPPPDLLNRALSDKSRHSPDPHRNLHAAVMMTPQISSPPPIKRKAEARAGEPTAEADMPKYEVDLTTLITMKYKDLHDQRFDSDLPAAPAPEPASTSGQRDAPPPLAARLEAMLLSPSTTQAEQHALFAHMPMPEWERAGEWFTQQFAARTAALVQSRAARRSALELLEQRVLERYGAVERDKEALAARLGEMGHSGSLVLQRERGGSGLASTR